jgi:hypothetical protein
MAVSVATVVHQAKVMARGCFADRRRCPPAQRTRSSFCWHALLCLSPGAACCYSRPPWPPRKGHDALQLHSTDTRSSSSTWRQRRRRPMARPRHMATGALDLEVHHARSVRRRSPGEPPPVSSGGPECLVGCAVGEDEAAVEGEGGGNRSWRGDSRGMRARAGRQTGGEIQTMEVRGCTKEHRARME